MPCTARLTVVSPRTLVFAEHWCGVGLTRLVLFRSYSAPVHVVFDGHATENLLESIEANEIMFMLVTEAPQGKEQESAMTFSDLHPFFSAIALPFRMELRQID